jgi:hypothetical protein
LGIDGSGGATWTCSLQSGTSWVCTSDRNLKENLVAVDGHETLERLSRVPIFTWNAKGQDPATRHIGPMAQDFYAAFEVGEDDRHLATIDLDGVALSAIQGLHQLSQGQAQRIAALEARNDDLEAENRAQQTQIDELATRLATLEAGAAQPLKGGVLPGAGILLAAAGLAWRGRQGKSPRRREGS